MHALGGWLNNWLPRPGTIVERATCEKNRLRCAVNASLSCSTFRRSTWTSEHYIDLLRTWDCGVAKQNRHLPRGHGRFRRSSLQSTFTCSVTLSSTKSQSSTTTPVVRFGRFRRPVTDANDGRRLPAETAWYDNSVNPLAEVVASRVWRRGRHTDRMFTAIAAVSAVVCAIAELRTERSVNCNSAVTTLLDNLRIAKLRTSQLAGWQLADVVASSSCNFD